MKRKQYYSPTLHDAGRVFRQTTADFITEWLSYIAKLADVKSPTSLQKAELRDCRPFLESVVNLTSTTEYASVDATHKTQFAKRANDLLDRIDGKAKNVEVDINLC